MSRSDCWADDYDVWSEEFWRCLWCGELVHDRMLTAHYTERHYWSTPSPGDDVRAHGMGIKL
jgi:hypothetical protein